MKVTIFLGCAALATIGALIQGSDIQRIAFSYLIGGPLTSLIAYCIQSGELNVRSVLYDCLLIIGNMISAPYLATILSNRVCENPLEAIQACFIGLGVLIPLCLCPIYITIREYRKSSENLAHIPRIEIISRTPGQIEYTITRPSSAV